MFDLFGTDIALDASLAPRIAANGELVLCSDTDTGIQDIRLRLSTYIGSLFYDQEYGSTLPDWLHDENTELARIGFAAEVKRRIGEDPRVVPGSVACAVTDWNELSMRAEASFRFIDEDHAYNLVITADNSKREMVIQDADPAVI
jgi:phage baseplate assembly protein W